ncbi:CHAT domain-containing protein [Microcoleus sp. FACHB-1515]|uniref:CHAT domain-containing protein n=1 Tax=Cyanophyceae TaxID=3028117 RepID=UPI001683BB2D|nr:CHAT domain-containing protein [Microcoleus sp. FACHB-1515]MBD2089036.1 CHAT domain-containing protein [Microcoleus sp. FACHB-1515]
MKHFFRSSLLFVVAIGCVLLLSLPTIGQTTPESGSLSSLRIDPARLSATLDRGDLTDAVQQLEQGWKVQFDEYYQRQITLPLLSPDQIVQSLRQRAHTGKRSALIYAISLPTQLEVMLLSPDGQPRHDRHPIAASEVQATTAALKSSLVNVIARPQDYLPAAQQLYQWLIAPFEAELQRQQIDSLIFCVGGGLRSVPIAALHDGSKFIIETYSVSLIPAFSLLDRRPARLDGLRVLAMGASEFEQESPLPAVPSELATIAQLWQSEVLLNEQFTVGQLRRQRSIYPYGIVHLATHAAFEPGEVQNSYIRFWDRPLRLDQLRDLQLLQPVVQLLVLSACRTALGDPNVELGFAGLAVQSGAKAALASWWSISDAATLVTMIDFYQQLKTAPTKAEALRQTQLALLRNQLHLSSPTIQQAMRGIELPQQVEESIAGDLSHPYYWAGFTMIGNPW